MKRFTIIISLLLCSMVMGCAGRGREKEKETGTGIESNTETKTETDSGQPKEEQTGVQITVWLDPASEYINRSAAGNYNGLKAQLAGSDKEQYFADIQWNLVDKSYLTPEQYRKELQDALDRGEGPDLIFMDEYNGINPKDMMESGALAEIENLPGYYGEELEYLPGTLEIGQQDGKQYVLPVSIQCPVLFGIEEELQKAGIDTKGGYGSLQELMEALLAAHEAAGRNILENAEALDWLEQYYVDETDTGTLELLARARECCGTDTSTFAAYDALNAGTALLGGCGVADCRRTGQNLCLLSKKQKAAFIYIPSADGRKRTVVSQSAGINAKSKYAAEISQAMMMYLFPLNHANTTGMVPAAENNYWNDNLGVYAFSVWDSGDKQYAFRASDLQDSVKRAFKKTVLGSAEDAVYAMHSLKDQQAGKNGAAQQEEKKVITVIYEDMGLGENSALRQWLQQSADAYNAGQEEYYVQLISTGESILAYSYAAMSAGGTEPDIALVLDGQLLDSYHIKCADMSGFLAQHDQELSFLPEGMKDGTAYGNLTAGLPYAAKEYGVWCNKKTLESAGLSGDWKPKDMQELADGLRLLKAAEGISTASVWESSAKALFTFMAPERLDTYLNQNEEGTWQVSAETWAEFMEALQQLRDEELTVPLECRSTGITEEEAAAGLAEGTVGAVLADNAFGGWYDGAHGLKPADGQREQLVFVPLSPMADVNMFIVSAGSKYPQAAAEFWLSAVSHESYAQFVSDGGALPVTQLSETVQAAMPCQRGGASKEDIANGLWQMGKSAEEIAGECQWFEPMEE